MYWSAQWINMDKRSWSCNVLKRSEDKHGQPDCKRGGIRLTDSILDIHCPFSRKRALLQWLNISFIHTKPNRNQISNSTLCQHNKHYVQAFEKYFEIPKQGLLHTHTEIWCTNVKPVHHVDAHISSQYLRLYTFRSQNRSEKFEKET